MTAFFVVCKHYNGWDTDRGPFRTRQAAMTSLMGDTSPKIPCGIVKLVWKNDKLTQESDW